MRLVILYVEEFDLLLVVRNQGHGAVAAHEYMIGFCCRIGNLEDLLKKIELPFRMEEGIRFI